MDRVVLREKAVVWLGKYKYLLLILAIGISLMLIPGSKEKEKPEEALLSAASSNETMSAELECILSNVQGAGRVQVMLTLRSGELTVYQTDKADNQREDTVIITGSDRTQNGLVQQIMKPTYRGAIVLCQGADSPTVCLAIKDAVSKVTGLDSSQISVLKMK